VARTGRTGCRYVVEWSPLKSARGFVQAWVPEKTYSRVAGSRECSDGELAGHPGIGEPTLDREALDIRSLWIEADDLVFIDRAMAIVPTPA
jgi:hypothetical protein